MVSTRRDNHKPELVMVVAFCAIGLLVTANMMLRVPDFGAIVEQLEQFP